MTRGLGGLLSLTKQRAFTSNLLPIYLGALGVLLGSLFSDSQKGAKASAMLYSLIETAKANNIEPYIYLKTVFTKLPQTESLEDVENLLPWNVALLKS